MLITFTYFHFTVPPVSANCGNSFVSTKDTERSVQATYIKGKNLSFMLINYYYQSLVNKMSFSKVLNCMLHKSIHIHETSFQFYGILITEYWYHRMRGRVRSLVCLKVRRRKREELEEIHFYRI